MDFRGNKPIKTFAIWTGIYLILDGILGVFRQRLFRSSSKHNQCVIILSRFPLFLLQVRISIKNQLFLLVACFPATERHMAALGPVRRSSVLRRCLSMAFIHKPPVSSHEVWVSPIGGRSFH